MKPSQHLNNRGIDILVVEDSPTQAEEIKFILTNKHYFVRTVVNGKEALLQIKKQKPLIVISDIIMPEMNGYDLCSYIKKNEKFSDIPVLLLTSLSDPKDIIHGLECGADNFIIKPFDENYLLSRIDYIVANQYIQERERLEVGVEIFFSGKKYFINSQKRQILDLLISTYETAVKKNEELQKTQIELRELNEGLEKRVEERTSLLKEEIQIRKSAEEKISRLNRVYSLLSNINRTIVRTKNIDELFSEACSVSVNVGQYNMVWIGLVDENNSNIKPVAWNGDANDYIDGLKICIDKKNGELGTVGKAVTEGHFIVCNDIENDESMKPRRSKALKKNFKSVASFPLSNNGSVIGAISFYSQYKNFFDNNEINLLDELSSDISFSIYSIQQEQLKLKAEEELKKSESRLRQILENVDAVFYMLSPKTGQIIYVNSAYERIWELPISTIKENPEGWLEVVHKDNRNLAEKLFEQQTGEIEYRIVLPDGRVKWIWDRIFPISDEKNEIIYICGMAADITDRKNSVEKIKLLANALESINECVSITDLDDNLTFVNNAFCKIYGYGRENLIGQNISIVRSENNHSEVIKEILPKTFDGGWQGELLNKRISGEEFPIYLSTSAILNEKGETTALMGVSTDITDRKKAEQDLIESEERYRSFVNSIPDLVFIKDGNLNYINVNNAFVKFLGKNNPSEVLGRDDSELLSNVLASQCKEGDLKVLAQKKLIINEEYSDGNCFETIKFPVPLSNNNIGVGGFIRDITDRKSAQEKIIKSEAEFRSVWDNSFDAMRLCNSQGIVLKVNQAFCDLMNKSKKEIEGQPYNIFYEPEIEFDPIEKYKNKFINRSINPKMETEIKLFDKRRIWVELTNSFIEIKDQPIMLLSIFRDVSKRKEYETQLVIAKEKAEEVNQLKNNFLANMSHELRTPMIGILGFSETLMAELDNEVYKDMASTIYYSGNRLLNTLNILLDLSKIESNRTDIKNQNLNIGNSVLTLAKSYSIQAEKKGLSFIISILDEKVSAELDKKLFTQIINNLLDNAVKFTHKGDIKIQVDSEIINDNVWAVIKIIDSGIGIPKEKLETIFEEFRQVSEGYSRSYEGTGLGLTITRKLVELMNGNISVESEVGIGSTFIVSFLAVVNDPNFSSKVINNFSNKILKPNMKSKILIVENDKVSLEYIKMILKKYFTVDTAENGQSAIIMSSSNEYSLIFMDIGLGIGINGMQTASEIRKFPGYENKPIVAITAYAMKGDKELFLSSGCSHYLSKPYTKDDLMNLVMSILQEKYAC
ncbi:MAG: PAS domain S-box protein [Bacteroidetes bacterium]|nr:PAS domain S-box protein [Bacteroidota bacterium]